MFQGKAANFVIIDHFRLGIYAVGDKVVILAGHVHGASMGQVAAVGKVHAEHGVAIVEQRKINGKVRLCAGMRLHIGMLRAEQFAGAFPGEVFNGIHALAAAVIPFAGVTLGVFVREMAAHRCHDCLRNEVFGCDQLQMVTLALELQLHRFGNLWVRCADQIKLGHTVLPF